jgi:hypothetical protein
MVIEHLIDVLAFGRATHSLAFWKRVFANPTHFNFLEFVFYFGLIQAFVTDIWYRKVFIIFF